MGAQILVAACEDDQQNAGAEKSCKEAYRLCCLIRYIHIYRQRKENEKFIHMTARVDNTSIPRSCIANVNHGRVTWPLSDPYWKIEVKIDAVLDFVGSCW